MSKQREFNPVEFVISHLALDLENAMVRLEAYRQVVAKHAPHLMFEVDTAEQSLADSPLRTQCNDLRTQAIQAVRDQDTNAMSESIAGLRGLARETRNHGRFAPEGNSK
jgi:hypothetical protein